MRNANTDRSIIKKNKKRSTRNITVIMVIIALAILVGYYYITAGKPKSSKEAQEATAQAQELLKRDLMSDYPKEPKDVVDLYSQITKVLYSEVEDEYVRELGKRVRMLYDEELLEINPEDKYFKELFTNISTWRDSNRKMTKYIVLDAQEDQNSVIDGVEYQAEYVSYTFQENAKFSQKWRFLLRKNDMEKWKIVGWEAISQASES